MKNTEKTMDKVVALCKNRGFVYAGSEIYGGLANTWDYGPLGVEFKNNVKKAWWKKFVQENPYNVGQHPIRTKHCLLEWGVFYKHKQISNSKLAHQFAVILHQLEFGIRSDPVIRTRNKAAQVD